MPIKVRINVMINVRIVRGGGESTAQPRNFRITGTASTLEEAVVLGTLSGC